VAAFLNPFPGVVPDRKLTATELTRGIRLALAAEEEAVHLYEALADATENESARLVFKDIADEERVHAGEFQRLLNILLTDEESLLNEGADEVDQLLASHGAGQSAAAAGGVPTVGDLKE